MNPKFLKGLFITIVAVITTALSNDPIIWSLVMINCIGSILIYAGKNAWYQSTSNKWSLEWKDTISAFLLALGNAIISGVSTLVIEGEINWKATLQLVAGVVSAYLASTVVTGTKKYPPDPDDPPK
jgi:hypothetical protein